MPSDLEFALRMGLATLLWCIVCLVSEGGERVAGLRTQALADGNRIELMTRDGPVTGYAVPTGKSHLYHILPGPDGALWFTEMDGNAIGGLALDPTASAPNP